MGTTNLQYALNNKISHLKGERDATRTRISRIEETIVAFSQMQVEVEQLDSLIEHATALIRHLQPSWSEVEDRSIRPFVKQIPTELGTCGRKAMNILRSALAPMSGLDLAIEILLREGISDTTQDVRQQMANTMQAALRSRRGKVVDCDGHWPQRWWVIYPRRSASRKRSLSWSPASTAPMSAV